MFAIVKRTESPTTEGLVACPICASYLDLHQPDLDDPDMLVALCVVCGIWFLDLDILEIRDVSKLHRAGVS